MAPFLFESSRSGSKVNAGTSLFILLGSPLGFDAPHKKLPQ